MKVLGHDMTVVLILSGKDHMDLLKSFPAVCKLSVKQSTPLPASAVCERLFSIAGLVFSPNALKCTQNVCFSI